MKILLNSQEITDAVAFYVLEHKKIKLSKDTTVHLSWDRSRQFTATVDTKC